MLLNICISGDAARMHCVRHCCRSPVASCHSQLPAQSIKCQKCIARERERKRERVNDVVTSGASRLVVRFLGMTDIWLVLTWTQFLTFILLGFLHNANGRAIDNIQHPSNIHSASIQHHVSMCQSVSQSVNVCISQFQISASAAALAASLWSPLDLHNLGPTKTPSTVALPRRLVVFPILNSNSQLVCKLLAPSEFWFVWNTFTQIWK